MSKTVTLRLKNEIYNIFLEMGQRKTKIILKREEIWIDYDAGDENTK